MKTAIIVSALALSAVATSPALALQGAPAVLPGTVDSAKAANASRNDSSSYNRTAGDHNQRVIKGKARPATAADIVAGRPLRDIKGNRIGIIEAVDADSAVVATDTGKVKLPLNAFGKDDIGLLLGISAAKFRSLVAEATAGAGAGG